MEILDDWKSVLKWSSNRMENCNVVIYSAKAISLKYYLPIYFKQATSRSIGDVKNNSYYLNELRRGKKTAVFFIDTPMSGIFEEEILDSKNILKWLSGNSKYVDKKDFSFDPGAELKRKYAGRTFPPYRITTYKFIIGQDYR